MLVDVSSFSPSSGQEPLPRQCRPKLVLTGTSIPLYVVSIPLSLSVDNSQHFTCPLIQTNATSEPDNLHSATNFYWPVFQWSGLFWLMDDEWCQNITFKSSEQTILEKLFLEIPYSLRVSLITVHTLEKMAEGRGGGTPIHCSPHLRESMKVLDSRSRPLDSRFQLSGLRNPYYSGFWIPNHCGFRIPYHSGFRILVLWIFGFWIPYSLTWDDIAYTSVFTFKG